jgi:uncharacterized protein
MSTAYFDSNAFIKLLVDEEGSELAITLWDGASEVVSNILAYPEVRAALAAAQRGNRINQGQLEDAEDEWEIYWSSVRQIDLTELIARIAAQECRNHALSGADGVHLASALALAEAEVVVVTWDKRLSNGARAAGLHVSP